MDYRFAPKNGLIFKAGGGRVFSAGKYEDFPHRYEYTGGGYFLDVSIDYQFRPGFTLGVYLSNAQGMNFDSYVTGDFTPSGEDVFDGMVSDEQANFGLSIGFAFPRRRKQ